MTTLRNFPRIRLLFTILFVVSSFSLWLLFRLINFSTPEYDDRGRPLKDDFLSKAGNELDPDYTNDVMSFTWPHAIHNLTLDEYRLGENIIMDINSDKIVIGALSCRNASTASMKYSEETVVMLKSVLISAKLYNVSEVEIHIFLEHLTDESYFRGKLGHFDMPGFKVILKIHSALEAIPKQYHNPMIYHPRYRCAWVRFFFPTALPEVDSIIHFDSDMIITGNIRKFWERFSLMRGEQFVGIGKGNEVHDRNYLHASKRWFGDIPHPPPKGINAGLLIMNLTRMRAYSWEEKFLRIYTDYSKLVPLTGQRAVSILLYFDQGTLQLLPCQFNFFHRHCDRGFTCMDAVADPYGIYLVHGNGRKMEKGEIFHGIFNQYKQFEMSANTTVDQVIKTLMVPIRNLFRDGPNPCFGTLNHLLFKNFFEASTNFTLFSLMSNVSFFSS